MEAKVEGKEAQTPAIRSKIDQEARKCARLGKVRSDLIVAVCAV